ncbi:MAG TPA: DHA2 family efflux MFS transporter permease subunit [Labilithrix sp.]|nr:DHA2 family efflux MFS transporter permease subunit [Labilithrix sp.]
MAVPADETALLGGSRVWLCLATMVAAFLALLDITIVNICLPQIQTTFAADVDQLGWVTTAYMMANVIVMPLTGWGRERFGYRRYFTVSCIVFAVGSALCASADTFTGFVVARAFQGLGGGALIPLSQAILLDRFPKRQFGLAGALFGVAALAGPMIGPSAGAYLLDYVGWPWLFRFSVPIAIAAAAIVHVHLEEPAPRGRDARFDLYGFALLAVGLGALQFVLEEGNRRDWFDSEIIVSLTIVAGICLPALVVHSIRAGGQAVVDLRVFANLRFTTASAINLMLGIAMISGSFFNALFFASVLDYTPLAIGSLLFWANALDFVAIPLSSLLLRWVDGRYLMGVGLMLLGWSFWLNAGLRLDSEFEQLVFPAAVRSFGSSLILVPLTIAAFIDLGERGRTGAVGLFNVLRELGASIGTAGATLLLTSRTHHHGAALIQSLAPRDLAPLARGGELAARSLERVVAIDSFNDVYVAFALLALLTLPNVLALRSKPSAATSR